VAVWGYSLGDSARPPTNEDAWAGSGLAAACLDGLGGHGDGAVASEIGARAFRMAVDAAMRGPQPAARLFDAMRTALLDARSEASSGGPENPVMSAAVVVGVLDPRSPELQLAWAGDCRAYVWSPAARTLAQRVTEDHDEIHSQWLHSRCSERAASKARWAVDRAQTASEAFHLGGPLAKKAFRRRHAMHAELAVGDHSVRTVLCQPGAFAILTTDGVHGNLTHPELEAAVTRHLANPVVSLSALPEAICLAAQAVAAEGTGRRHPDDITCVVLSR
jgi:serine/threonine protein phosphatase PrpC